jgi:hypothetical protein
MAMKAITKRVVLGCGIACLQAAAADELTGSLLDDRKNMNQPRDPCGGLDTAGKKCTGVLKRIGAE